MIKYVFQVRSLVKMLGWQHKVGKQEQKLTSFHIFAIPKDLFQLVSFQSLMHAFISRVSVTLHSEVYSRFLNS